MIRPGEWGGGINIVYLYLAPDEKSLSLLIACEIDEKIIHARRMVTRYIQCNSQSIPLSVS